jgi:hypothetical protein
MHRLENHERLTPRGVASIEQNLIAEQALQIQQAQRKLELADPSFALSRV